MAHTGYLATMERILCEKHSIHNASGTMQEWRDLVTWQNGSDSLQAVKVNEECCVSQIIPSKKMQC